MLDNREIVTYLVSNTRPTNLLKTHIFTKYEDICLFFFIALAHNWTIKVKFCFSISMRSARHLFMPGAVPTSSTPVKCGQNVWRFIWTASNADSLDLCYRAFHWFGQAKYPDGGSVLGLSQFSILPQLH